MAIFLGCLKLWKVSNIPKIWPQPKFQSDSMNRSPNLPKNPQSRGKMNRPFYFFFFFLRFLLEFTNCEWELMNISIRIFFLHKRRFWIRIICPFLLNRTKHFIVDKMFCPLDKIFFPWTKHLVHGQIVFYIWKKRFVQGEKQYICRIKRFIHGQNVLSYLEGRGIRQHFMYIIHQPGMSDWAYLCSTVFILFKMFLSSFEGFSLANFL